MTTMERARHGRGGKIPAAGPGSWEEVNQRLACLGEADRQIRSLRDQFEQKVAVLKQQLLEASQPVSFERKKIQEEIERFYWAHRNEVLAGGRKSVELAFGRMGSRSSRGVVVEDSTAAQQWLAAHGLKQYLRVRTEIDRESLRSAMLGVNNPGNAADAELVHCPGISLRESEEFWYEVDQSAWAAPAELKTGGQNGCTVAGSR